MTGGATLVIGEDGIAGGVWTIPAGAAAPDSFSPFTTGTLELAEAGTEPGAAIVGSFSGVFEGILSFPDGSEGSAGTTAADTGLVINEVAAKGDPLDWFELHNASGEEIALADFVVADDLKDAAKWVAFLAELVIPQGGYLQIELDSGRLARFRAGWGRRVGHLDSGRRAGGRG